MFLIFSKSQAYIIILPTPKHFGDYRNISVKDEHRLKVSKIIISPQALLK